MDSCEQSSFCSGCGLVAARKRPFVCVDSERCQDANGNTFTCKEQNVACCARADSKLNLVDSPNGTKCCTGSGNVVGAKSEICYNGWIYGANMRSWNTCGRGAYNNETQVCCVASKTDALPHTKRSEGQWGCCGREYVNLGTKYGCCDGVTYNKLEWCCHEHKLQRYGSYNCMHQQEAKLRVSSCHDSTSSCCGGERIEDPERYFCYRGFIWYKTDPSHDNVCLYTDSDGNELDDTYNNATQECDSRRGPVARQEMLCGEDPYNPALDLCCDGQIHIGKAEEWKCCPGLTCIYKKGDKEGCPDSTEPTPRTASCSTRRREKRCSKEMIEKRTKGLIERGSHVYGFTVGREKGSDGSDILYKVKSTKQLISNKRSKVRMDKVGLKVVEFPSCGCLSHLEPGKEYIVLTKSKIDNKKLRLNASKYVILPVGISDAITTLFSV